MDCAADEDDFWRWFSNLVVDEVAMKVGVSVGARRCLGASSRIVMSHKPKASFKSHGSRATLVIR